MNKKFRTLGEFNLALKLFNEKIEDMEVNYTHELNHLKINEKMVVLSDVVIINKVEESQNFYGTIEYKTPIRNQKIKKMVDENFNSLF
ncbi:MAG: hypothetical protein ACRYFB_01515 [Janthinobacterium lividum]